ncbi:hypothetical protein Bca52824_007737 [Brassica carinata]|uniref:Uncharacterized protein n=1 Tax=Brassica carinata TaxID=52824 RepID=A0A8X7W8J0_BRACI|nr:hypothetical protein Bca52824_007737 [Brassica carinata]
MTTTQTEGCLGGLEKNQQTLGEKLDGNQDGLKDVLDRILRQTEMVAATQVGTVSQETSTDFVVIPIKKSHCVIKKVDEFKDQATEIHDLGTEGEFVIFKLQPQVSEKQQPKLVCGNQQVLTDTLDFDEDDFIVFEGRALE